MLPVVERIANRNRYSAKMITDRAVGGSFYILPDRSADEIVCTHPVVLLMPTLLAGIFNCCSAFVTEKRPPHLVFTFQISTAF
jgi:hypothetical protein